MRRVYLLFLLIAISGCVAVRAQDKVKVVSWNAKHVEQGNLNHLLSYCSEQAVDLVCLQNVAQDRANRLTTVAPYALLSIIPTELSFQNKKAYLVFYNPKKIKAVQRGYLKASRSYSGDPETNPRSANHLFSQIQVSTIGDTSENLYAIVAHMNDQIAEMNNQWAVENINWGYTIENVAVNASNYSGSLTSSDENNLGINILVDAFDDMEAAFNKATLARERLIKTYEERANLANSDVASTNGKIESANLKNREINEKVYQELLSFYQQIQSAKQSEKYSGLKSAVLAPGKITSTSDKALKSSVATTATLQTAQNAERSQPLNQGKTLNIFHWAAPPRSEETNRSFERLSSFFYRPDARVPSGSGLLVLGAFQKSASALSTRDSRLREQIVSVDLSATNESTDHIINFIPKLGKLSPCHSFDSGRFPAEGNYPFCAIYTFESN